MGNSHTFYRRDLLKVVGIAAVAGILVAPAIANAEEKIEGPLYIESWGGSYGEAVTKYLIEPFKAKYGIEVKLSYFGNNAEQLAKLKAGKSRIDVSFLSNSYVYRAAKMGVLQTIRLENVPNYDQLFDKFKRPSYDPGKEPYAISYFWGDAAIAYNTDKIKEVPTSWAALWDKRYKGRVSFYGTAPEPIFVGALMVGQDPGNITDLGAIKGKLEELTPNLLKFWNSGAENTQLFATGEVWIANFWRGRVNNLRKEGHPIAYVVPKEGTRGWVDTMVIPAGAKNNRAAEAFMNFTLDPKIHQAFVLNGINYAPTGKNVKLTPEQAQKLGSTQEILSGVVFPDPEYELKNADEWNRLINEIKS